MTMKSTDIKITTLSEDIRQIANRAGGKKLDMLRFSRDHPQPILLRDKKPILDITQDEFVGIFDLKSNHYFLSPAQVYRAGTYCKLSLPALIALMLKAAWEIYMAELSGFLKDTSPDLGSRLKDPIWIEKLIKDFIPSRDKFYALLMDYAEGAESNTTYSKCDFYILDLLEENTFLIGNERIEELYPETFITEKMLLHRLPESQRAAYFRQKERWKLKSSELDDLLLYLERRKRTNQNMEDRYFRTFAKSEVEKSKLQYRIEKLRIILKLIPDHPNLSYREFLGLAADKMLKTDKERNDLIKIISRSLTFIGDPGLDNTDEPVTAEFRNAYMDACKKKLKKLFFLLHSDTCPNYQKLSQQKQGQINELWLQLMQGSREESYSFSQSRMLYSLPDLEKLELIYRRACEILDISPENFEVGNRLEFMISKGAPMNQILQFLNNETESFELHLAHLELIQNEYTNEDKTHFYREALNDITVHSDSLKKEIAELRDQVQNLKMKISNNLVQIAK
jgi:hypothetical protein